MDGSYTQPSQNGTEPSSQSIHVLVAVFFGCPGLHVWHNLKSEGNSVWQLSARLTHDRPSCCGISPPPHDVMSRESEASRQFGSRSSIQLKHVESPRSKMPSLHWAHSCLSLLSRVKQSSASLTQVYPPYYGTRSPEHEVMIPSLVTSTHSVSSPFTGSQQS